MGSRKIELLKGRFRRPRKSRTGHEITAEEQLREAGKQWPKFEGRIKKQENVGHRLHLKTTEL